jgi:16S rRNA G966 N2-methylase RsmD
MFADPPYRMTAAEAGQQQLAEMASELAACGLLAPAAVVMLRTERDTKIPLPWPGFALFDQRSYGSTTLHLMVLAARTEPLPPWQPKGT